MTDKAIEIKREYARQYRAKNREKLNEYSRNWRKENPDKVKGYHEAYWEKKAGNL